MNYTKSRKGNKPQGTESVCAKWKAGDVILHIPTKKQVIFHGYDKDDDGKPFILTSGEHDHPDQFKFVRPAPTKAKDTDKTEISQDDCEELLEDAPSDQDVSKKPPTNKNKERWKMFNSFCDQAMKKIPKGAPRDIWTQIFRHTMDGKATPSIELMAERTDYSEMQVKRAVKVLIALGFLKKPKKGGINRGFNQYVIFSKPVEEKG